MTRNSAAFLENCLSSIEKSVDLNRLIIVDGNSGDDTIEIAKKHNALILNDRGLGLGYARKLAIKHIETPWFAFVDSDVELGEKWLQKILGYKLYNPGAIESLTINIPIHGEEAITRTHNEVMNLRYNCAREINGKTGRGFTGATLIKLEAVVDAEIPNVPCCEDWYLTQHVLSKGYRWYKAPVKVKHYDRFSERPNRIRQTHALGRKIGYMSLPWLIKKTVTALIGRMLLSIIYLNPQYFIHRIKYSKNALDGWLHPEKHANITYPGWEVT